MVLRRSHDLAFHPFTFAISYVMQQYLDLRNHGQKLFKPIHAIRFLVYLCETGMEKMVRLIFYVGRWRVSTANSKKLEEMFHAIIAHVRSNPQRYAQLRSAAICSSARKDSSEEGWMWIEEYADQEAMDAFYKAIKEDKTFLEIHDKQYDFWRLIVDGSFNDEVYAERVRF
jgi:quinol monooxygenase YgiN